ncbi:unnamed protein product [Amaranthus hypochondriacus]
MSRYFLNKMIDHTSCFSSYTTFLIVAAVICCYAVVSLSYSFTTDDNPIRQVSDASQLHFQYSADAFSAVDHHQDHDHDFSFAPYYPSIEVEAIYQFGDSISDTGNFIRQNPSSNFANLPYGETFFHKPTGRCSNGLIMIDFICKFYKLPFLEPYLKKDGNFNHGVNFAVAGSTALNTSTLVMKGIKPGPTNTSLFVQLDWFKSHLNSICSSPSECKEKLSKALFMMGEMGGNDYNWAFIQNLPMTETYNMVPLVVQAIKHAVEEVINVGAIRIVVPGNFPIGCMTCNLNMFKTYNLTMYDELKCLKNLNNHSNYHNNMLQQAIEELKKDHPHVTIVYGDYTSAMQQLLRDSASLGFDEERMQEACCVNCGNKGGSVCENPYKHVSWDSVHLTQHAYEIMAKWLIKNNFHDLGVVITSMAISTYSISFYFIFFSLIFSYIFVMF